jgi:hypothetical protein
MLIAGLVALAALSVSAASAATQVVGWQDLSDSDASITFNDVVATDQHVIAVGTANAGTAGESAVIRHRAAGAWVIDTIAFPDVAPSASRLTAIAIGSGSAWAVGSYTTPSGVRPLLARVGSLAGLTGAAPVTWTVRDDTELPTQIGTPTAVGMHGGIGVIGDNRGQVFAFGDSGGPVTIGLASNQASQPDPSQSSEDGAVLHPAINGVSVYSDGEGFAVTDSDGTANNSIRIYRVVVNNSSTLPTAALRPIVDTSTDSANANLVSVAATRATDGITIEGTGAEPTYWKAGASATGSWTRVTTEPGTTGPFDGAGLNDASIVGVGGSARYAIAGSYDADDPDNKGAVWRFTGSAWTRDDLAEKLDEPAFPAMNGVAIVSSDDIWAVGGGGKIVRYSSHEVPDENQPTDLPSTRVLSGPNPDATISTSTATFTFDAGEGNVNEGLFFRCQLDSQPVEVCSSPYVANDLSEGQHTFSVEARNSAGAGPTIRRTFYVRFPDKACTLPPRRLARRVKVQKRPGKLRISFFLAARAKVRAVAVAGKRTVGKTSWFTLNRGRRRLVVHLRRTPTTLRLIAKPATKCST